MESELALSFPSAANVLWTTLTIHIVIISLTVVRYVKGTIIFLDSLQLLTIFFSCSPPSYRRCIFGAVDILFSADYIHFYYFYAGAHEGFVSQATLQ